MSLTNGRNHGWLRLNTDSIPDRRVWELIKRLIEGGVGQLRVATTRSPVSDEFIDQRGQISTSWVYVTAIVHMARYFIDFYAAGMGCIYAVQHCSVCFILEKKRITNVRE